MILEVLKCIAFMKKRDWRIRCFLNLDRRREESGRTDEDRVHMSFVHAATWSSGENASAAAWEDRAPIPRTRIKPRASRFLRFMRNRRRPYARRYEASAWSERGGELTLATHSNSWGDATTCAVSLNVAHDRNLCSRAHAGGMTRLPWNMWNREMPGKCSNECMSNAYSASESI